MIARNTTYALDQQKMADEADLVHTAISNMCLSPAGLDIGFVAPEQILITNTVAYTSGGQFKSKATAEVPFTATVHDIAPHATLVKEALYLMTLAANGDPTLTMGTITTGAGTAKLPERPTTGTPIGAVRVAVDAGVVAFDASSDALDDAHLTVTYYDYGYLAPRFDAAQ